MSLDRRPFPTDAAHAPLLRLLLAQDGSTTRVCEAVAGAAVQVVLHRQSSTRDVPLAVREQLGGTAWLERITSLVDGSNVVMMDNLSYTRLDAVPGDFLEALDAGSAPIGHLLASLFVQREAVPGSEALRQRLWGTVGEADDRASRSYRIVTPQGPLMLIFEAFRAGMSRTDE